MSEFDEKIGLKHLRALHLNDSKAPLGSKKDLHANIGTGFLGLQAFHHLMNDCRLEGIPMILETPIDKVIADGKSIEDKSIWAQEIKLLETLIGMDIESPAFKDQEAKLSEIGKAERKRLLDLVERKEQEKRKKRKSH